MCAGEVDARLVRALRQEVAGVVAAVPAHGEAAAGGRLPGHEGAHDRALVVFDLHGDAVRPTEPEGDGGRAPRTPADRREDLERDLGARDRAVLELQPLGHGECSRGPAEQADDEHGREEPRHKPPGFYEGSSPRTSTNGSANSQPTEAP